MLEYHGGAIQYTGTFVVCSGTCNQQQRTCDRKQSEQNNCMQDLAPRCEQHDTCAVQLSVGASDTLLKLQLCKHTTNLNNWLLSSRHYQFAIALVACRIGDLFEARNGSLHLTSLCRNNCHRSLSADCCIKRCVWAKVDVCDLGIEFEADWCLRRDSGRS